MVCASVKAKAVSLVAELVAVLAIIRKRSGPPADHHVCLPLRPM